MKAKKAKHLKNDPKVLNLNKDSDVLVLDSLISHQFEDDFAEFVTEQKKKLKLDNLAKQKFDIIKKMARNLTPFQPKELLKCPESTESVVPLWIHKKLMAFLFSDVNSLTVNSR